MINIAGMNKAAVLAVLYNASRPQGMGFLQYDPQPMTEEEAAQLLESSPHFDYLKGRVMKIKLEGDELNEWGYDYDNGQGAASRAIDSLRRDAVLNAPEVEQLHAEGKLSAAAAVKAHLTDEDRIEPGVLTIGLADVADVLGPAVDKAIEQRAHGSSFLN